MKRIALDYYVEIQVGKRWERVDSCSPKCFGPRGHYGARRFRIVKVYGWANL